MTRINETMRSDTHRFARAICAPVIGSSALLLVACGGDRSAMREPDRTSTVAAPARAAGVPLRLRDTTVAGAFAASGIAQAMQQATLSTKLMGTVQEVLVVEGDAVRTGQVLLRIDARELTAKANSVASSITEAEALQQDATTQVGRMRALYADSAATRAQLDAAEMGLIRANAAVHAARAAASEVEAMSSYATIRAPFNGVVTQRLADAGTFAAPGASLLVVQDISTLRISASLAAATARLIRRGQVLNATIDGVPVAARVEGIVPAGAGNLFAVNATVPNPRDEFRVGSAAVLSIPGASHQALLVPLNAIIREGDLTGVIVRGPERDERRWIRLGTASATTVEVTGGLQAGEEIVVPVRGTAVLPSHNPGV